MQGQQVFQPTISLGLDLDSFIPSHHLLRKIDKLIDFTFIRSLTEPYYCKDNGRPSIDPEVFFRMLLVGYLYGIQSDRRLCEDIHYNLAYRWFCHLSLADKVPDHSSVTRIRDRLGLAVFKQFFHAILNQCKDKGLIKGQCVISDSLLVAANASLNSLVAKDPVQAAHEQQDFRRGLEAPKPRRVTNQTHISQTDPDATLAQKAGSPRHLKYKAHVAIDTSRRIILDTKMTTGACHESQVYVAQLQEIKREQHLPIEETIADRAYGSGDILQQLQNQQITPYIPLFSGRSGGFMVNETMGFSFESGSNRYRCPAGYYLVPYPTPSRNVMVYHSQVKDCKTCSLITTCRAKVKANTVIRVIHRNIHQALFESTAKRMETPLFRAKLAERLWKIEGILQEAKANHCLGRAKYRGLSKMQIQAYLSASAQNIKRIIFIILLYQWFTHLIFHSITFIKDNNKKSPEFSYLSINAYNLRVFQQAGPFYGLESKYTFSQI